MEVLPNGVIPFLTANRDQFWWLRDPSAYKHFRCVFAPVVSDSTSHSLPPPAPSPRFWHFISEYMDRWLTVSRFRLGDHHCRWENLICMHGGEQGDKLRKPPLSSSGLYLGLWQPWKGWYRFLTFTLTIGSAAFNLNPWTFQQCCRNVGPVSPWISG